MSAGHRFSIVHVVRYGTVSAIDPIINGPRLERENDEMEDVSKMSWRKKLIDVVSHEISYDYHNCHLIFLNFYLLYFDKLISTFEL